MRNYNKNFFKLICRKLIASSIFVIALMWGLTACGSQTLGMEDKKQLEESIKTISEESIKTIVKKDNEENTDKTSLDGVETETASHETVDGKVVSEMNNSGKKNEDKGQSKEENGVPTTPQLPPNPTQPQPPPTPEVAQMPRLQITAGAKSFFVKLYDNAATRALLKKLPLTLDMGELNGNEKYYYLKENLPTDSKKMSSVNAGDLMLYGQDCLVLFYEDFATSYSYTSLGHIEDAAGLAEALGSGSVQVTFTAKH